MKLWKQYWLWIFLLVPATYLFLRPLLFRPELLQPILPDSWYDSWEEFAVMQLSGLLAFGMLSLAFLVFGIGIFKLFSARTKLGRKWESRLVIPSLPSGFSGAECCSAAVALGRGAEESPVNRI